jgi:hypothetical protein
LILQLQTQLYPSKPQQTQLYTLQACRTRRAASSVQPCPPLSSIDISADPEHANNSAVVLSLQVTAGAGSNAAAAGGEAVPPLAQARRAAVTLLRLQGQLLLEAKRMDEVRAGSGRV